MEKSSKEFLLLQEEWYLKLKNSGFVDAEKRQNNGRWILKQEDNRFCRKGRNDDEIKIRAKIEYYTQLGQYANDPNTWFRNDIDRFIMQLLAEGAIISEIKQEVFFQFEIDRHLNTIRYITRKYERLWGLKNRKIRKIRMIHQVIP
jgi:hypothetical protein